MLYLTLELPKRIINDAIAAPSDTVEFYGATFSQIHFLLILCGLFLLAVILHGLLKMRINTMKGVLAERLLRRYRYGLISRILRFPQPYFERTSQGELVSMVTSESEPMGGLMGDAMAQPVLQAGQMLTILGFLFAQSVTFGLAACALIPLQAWLIPKLQKQINLLNKKRVVQVRALAAEIGESASGAATLRVNGGWRFRMAMITDRLGRLYEIRFDIYQKKFFMKFLNNFITQLTPFFFFSIGGYLVIQGQVSLGALVAALAAYKDLSSPWKELLDYYNQSQDMQLRWETIAERFAPTGMIDEDKFYGQPDSLPHLDGDVVLDGVTVRDGDGNAVLEDITATLPAGRSIAITAPSDEDRRALAQVLTRETMPTSGRVRLGDHALNDLHQGVIAARIGHATSRPVMFQGSFGDNIMMALKHQPHGDGSDADFAAEALRAGNSADMLDAPWMDLARSGTQDDDALLDWWLALVDGMGSSAALFRRATEQRIDATGQPELAQRLVDLRGDVAAALEEADLIRYADIFREDAYNAALPVAENLLFATARQPVTPEFIAGQPEFLKLLAKLGLDRDLLALTRDVIDLLRQIFGIDGTDHPLFRKLTLEAETYEAAVAILSRQREGTALTTEDTALLLTVPFQITSDQIGAGFPDEIKARVLDMRGLHAEALQASLGAAFAPIRVGKIVAGLTVLENALFGKIPNGAGSKGDEVRAKVAQVMQLSGMGREVMRLILDVPIALGGANLPAFYAEPAAVSRAAIKRPDILILEDVLASFDAATQDAMFANLRVLLPETTLIFIAASFEHPDAFDMQLELLDGRIVGGAGPQSAKDDSATSADLARKVQALGSTDLFSGVSRKQLRLLAFGARWYRCPAGEYVFHKNDPPADGAYMILEGQADLWLPHADKAAQLITTVGAGALVGELGLIRNEPRALDMQAKTDLLCLRIGVEEFLAVVENDATTAFKLLQVVAGYVST